MPGNSPVRFGERDGETWFRKELKRFIPTLPFLGWGAAGFSGVAGAAIRASARALRARRKPGSAFTARSAAEDGGDGLSCLARNGLWPRGRKSGSAVAAKAVEASADPGQIRP